MNCLALTSFVLLATIIYVNAEKCPKPEPINCFRCQDQCKDDRGCGRNESCCRENCGNVCRPTAPKNQGRPANSYTCGYCPPEVDEDCEGTCRDDCGPDQPCDFGLVCCQGKCGNRCQPESQNDQGNRATGNSCS